MNWYIEAKSSDNKEIKNLIEKFDKTDIESPEKKEIENKIKELLKSNPFKVEENKITISPVKKNEEKKEEEKAKGKENKENNSFPFTDDSIQKCKTIDELNKIVEVCRIKRKEIEDSRLKKETIKQRREISKRSWSIYRIERKAINKIRDIKNIKKAELKKSIISQIESKRNRFIKLYSEGYSITNICRMGEVKKEEILTIVNENVIKTITTQYDKYFIELWNRWKEKNCKG